MVSRIINFCIIYAALRVITLFIEDIVSDKLVFFIAKMSKNVESPPVECNEEANVDETQSKVGGTMETIYMYVTGAIVWIILIIILVIQLPHPWMGACRNINNTIGKILLNSGFYLTINIGAEAYKKACGDVQKNMGLSSPGFVDNLSKKITEFKLPEGNMANNITKVANNITKVANEAYSANMEKNKISLGLKTPPISKVTMAEQKNARIQAEDKKKGAAQDALRAEGRRAAEAEAQAEAQAQKRRNDYDKDQQIQDKDRERGAAEDALRAERRRAAEAEARAAQAQAQANKSSDQITSGNPGRVTLERLPKGLQPSNIGTPNLFGTKTPLPPIGQST
jgi:hypothetical protein